MRISFLGYILQWVPLIVLHISAIQMTLCVIKIGFQMCSFTFSYVKMLLTKLTWLMERGFFTCSTKQSRQGRCSEVMLWPNGAEFQAQTFVKLLMK